MLGRPALGAGRRTLIRSGATLTSYYKSNGNWVQLATGTTQPTPTIILSSFKSYAEFGHQAAKIAFDNFRVDATNFDCSDIRPNLHPDWAPPVK